MVLSLEFALSAFATPGSFLSLALGLAIALPAMAISASSSKRRRNTRREWEVMHTIASMAGGDQDLRTFLATALGEVLRVLDLRAGSNPLEPGSGCPAPRRVSRFPSKSGIIVGNRSGKTGR